MYDPFTARFVSDISLSGLMTQYLHESHTSEIDRRPRLNMAHSAGTVRPLLQVHPALLRSRQAKSHNPDSRLKLLALMGFQSGSPGWRLRMLMMPVPQLALCPGGSQNLNSTVAVRLQRYPSVQPARLHISDVLIRVNDTQANWRPYVPSTFLLAGRGPEQVQDSQDLTSVRWERRRDYVELEENVPFLAVIWNHVVPSPPTPTITNQLKRNRSNLDSGASKHHNRRGGTIDPCPWPKMAVCEVPFPRTRCIASSTHPLGPVHISRSMSRHPWRPLPHASHRDVLSMSYQAYLKHACNCQRCFFEPNPLIHLSVSLHRRIPHAERPTKKGGIPYTPLNRRQDARPIIKHLDVCHAAEKSFFFRFGDAAGGRYRSRSIKTVGTRAWRGTREGIARRVDLGRHVASGMLGGPRRRSRVTSLAMEGDCKCVTRNVHIKVLYKVPLVHRTTSFDWMEVTACIIDEGDHHSMSWCCNHWGKIWSPIHSETHLSYFYFYRHHSYY
ncbi:hypothetical protein V8E55_006820 [Tylopilus felleus]